MNSSRMMSVVLAGLLLAAGRVGAQVPEPFAYMPADAQLLVRIDCAKLESSPRTGESFREARKGLLRTWLANVPDPEESLKLMSQVRIMEMGIRYYDSTGDTAHREYAMTAYGSFDANWIMEHSKKEGHTPAGEYKGMTLISDGKASCLTMPNTWTVLFAQTLDGLKAMIDQKESGTSVFASPLFAGAKDGCFFMGGVLSQTVRQELIQKLRADDPNLQTFPSAQQLVAQLPQLNGVSLTMTESDFLKAELALCYDSEASGQKTAEALNMQWPLVLNMVAMQVWAAGEATLTQEIQKLATVRFGAQGNVVQGTIPISDNLIVEINRLRGEWEVERKQQIQEQQQPTQ